MFHLITVIFVIAKIMNYVTFSWFIVFLPSIIVILFPIVLVTALGIFTVKHMK